MSLDVAIIACLAAVRSYEPPGMPTETTVQCISHEEMQDRYPHAAGLYYGDSDEIFIVAGMPDDYTRMVLAHEAGHAIDLHAGRDNAGYPVFWSELYGGMDAEVFARLYSWHVGMWPSWEVFPDPIPAPERIEVLVQLGLLPRLEPAPQVLVDGTLVSHDATVVTAEDVGLPTMLLECPAWKYECYEEEV